MNAGNHHSILKTILLTIILWLTGIGIGFSQDYIFDVDIINVEDGLPHRMAYYIVQDKEGFIWVNTQGAISRYDGYSFKTYGASFLNVGETSGIRMAIDVNNRLWYREHKKDVFTVGVIDTAKDSICSIEAISKGRFMAEDVIYIVNSKANSDEIIIATRSGIIYNYNGDFEEIYRLPPPVSPHLICEAAPDGSYWIVNHEDIIKVKDGKRLKTISAGVRGISIVSTYPKLVLKINNPLHPVRFWTIANDTLVPNSIPPHPPENIKEVLQLHKDYTCYITKDALMIRDKKEKLLFNFDELNPSEHFPDLASYPKLLDQQDILWITTENGLLKLTAKQNPFEVLLPGDSMRGIFKDKETLWIGGGGYRDTLSDAVKPEQEYLNPRLNDAMSFHKDLQGHLWIGTRGKKILEYIPGQDKYIHYNFSAEKRSFYLPFQNPVTKNYWIGTNNGLVRFNKKRKEVTSFPLPAVSKTLIIRQFHYNAQGMWIASSKGIFLMDAEKETIIKHYNTANEWPAC